MKINKFSDCLIEFVGFIPEKHVARVFKENGFGVSMSLYLYSESIIAGLSVFGDTDQMASEEIETEIISVLRSSIKEISLHLGYEK